MFEEGSGWKSVFRKEVLPKRVRVEIVRGPGVRGGGGLVDGFNKGVEKAGGVWVELSLENTISIRSRCSRQDCGLLLGDDQKKILKKKKKELTNDLISSPPSKAVPHH